MEEFIELKDLKFSYCGKINAIEDFNLKIRCGEFISIVGGNGSGKSTLAKLLNATLIPSSGSVEVFGLSSKNFEDLFEIKKSVGVVFQNPENQLVSTVVEEDVAFALENLCVSRDEMIKIVEESLKMVGMEKFKKSVVSNLSCGQKQKVAIAGVLAMKPRCIVFDEATSMLNSKSRDDVVNIMVNLNKEYNATVVNITHNMEEVVFSDRVVVLRKGKILGQGSPREVFSNETLINDAFLSLPQVTEFFNLLWKNGIAPKKTVLTADECFKELYYLLK